MDEYYDCNWCLSKTCVSYKECGGPGGPGIDEPNQEDISGWDPVVDEPHQEDIHGL